MSSELTFQERIADLKRRIAHKESMDAQCELDRVDSIRKRQFAAGNLRHDLSCLEGIICRGKDFRGPVKVSADCQNSEPVVHVRFYDDDDAEEHTRMEIIKFTFAVDGLIQVYSPVLGVTSKGYPATVPSVDAARLLALEAIEAVADVEKEQF